MRNARISAGGGNVHDIGRRTRAAGVVRQIAGWRAIHLYAEACGAGCDEALSEGRKPVWL